MRKRTGLNILSFCRKDDKSGHDGSLSTGHANSCRDMLSRLETMVLMGMELPLPAIRSQIASGLDILIHLGRQKDKSRKVLDIMEIAGIENGEIRLRELFRYRETDETGAGECGLIRVGSLLHREKCRRAGYELS